MTKSVAGTFIPGLNGLRGISALLIIVYHAKVLSLPGGSLGVDVFFVLSGFLITSIISAELEQTGRLNFRNFYAKRALRLFPALALVVIAFLLFSHFVFTLMSPHDDLQASVFTALYLMNWSRAFGWARFNVLDHTWSLSVEEQFYLVWPLICIGLFRLPTLRAKIICTSILLIASIVIRYILTFKGASTDRIYNGFDTRADDLLAGCLLAFALSSARIDELCRQKMPISLRFWTPVSVVILVLHAMFVDQLSRFANLIGFTIVQIAAVILILNVLYRRTGLTNSILSNKIVVWLGTISYGLYLWHFPTLMFLQKLEPRPWQLLGYNFAVTLVLAVLSFYLVEKRFLQLKRYFVSRADQRQLNGSVEEYAA
ncbi:acyltransferase [Phyllobacterium sp. OV277]|uniref:acyltransferase family protein n=1 Tax=Phyllobacterium sp. OV277 TaxID=1882772 RepID=UPI00088FD00F|nr:acyltransferase [Phyllobacterium sp. OV277]SDP63318.1 Peptidoglycan/LPS O-acetylase OafA/YrhL, contains acyltransferase and SGNH-hydrolase domains [Phyllobacterium sp. OV277]